MYDRVDPPASAVAVTIDLLSSGILLEIAEEVNEYPPPATENVMN